MVLYRSSTSLFLVKLNFDRGVIRHFYQSTALIILGIKRIEELCSSSRIEVVFEDKEQLYKDAKSGITKSRFFVMLVLSLLNFEMDIVQNTPPVQAPEGGGTKGKKKFWKFFIPFLALVVIVAAGSFAWVNYLSPEAKRAQETKANLEKFNAGMQAYEDAMRADTYGGKTPEETLRMFIDALKKNDVELASKYFMLDTNSQSPDYLTRRKWENALTEVQTQGKLVSTIELLEKAKPAGSVMKNYFGFEIRDDLGNLLSDIGFELNKYSNVWKIESL